MVLADIKAANMEVTGSYIGDGSALSGIASGPEVRGITLTGLNVIRQLQDRTVGYSTQYLDGIGEAYIDATGRNDYVDTGSTTALFNPTDLAYNNANWSDEASGDTTHDPNGFSSAANAFDNDDGTLATRTSVNPNKALGKTFGAKTIGIVKVKATLLFVGGSGTNQKAIKLQSYNGSVWSDEITLIGGNLPASTISYDGTFILNKSVQGLRIQFSTVITMTAQLYTLEYDSVGTSAATEITHDLPTGTFESTISSAIGVPFVNSWETGDNVQYKLINASEDTGWLDAMNTAPEISTFTAFTLEPTKLIVRLNPKPTSPLSGLPSIKGFWVYAY